MRKVSAEVDKMAGSASGMVRGFDSFGTRLSDIGTRLSLGVSLPLAGLSVAAVKADAELQALTMGLTAVSGSAGATRT